MSNKLCCIVNPTSTCNSCRKGLCPDHLDELTKAWNNNLGATSKLFMKWSGCCCGKEGQYITYGGDWNQSKISSKSYI